MTETPIPLPGTPEPSSSASPLLGAGRADLLTDVLQRVHLASAVFLRGEFSAPWAFVSTDQATLAQVLRPGARRLVLFHIVVEGAVRIRLPSGESACASAGDAIVLPYCDLHSMGQPDEAIPVPIAELFPPPPWSEIPVVRIQGGGAPTRILCGYLHCEDLLFNPVLKALPRLIHVKPSSDSAAQWREASLRYVLERADRPGADNMLERLPELVLVDCLLQYVNALSGEEQGWIAALKDPVIGKVLVSLHAQPAAAWTVATLARDAAVSRSVLAQRFTDLLGVPPMRYLAQWRLQLAADLLRTSGLGIAAIAARVGYDSEAAFSRAFKRNVGLSPASWRERQASP